MRVRCFHCNVPISTEVPDGFVMRGVAECPECIEKASQKTHLPTDTEKRVIDMRITRLRTLLLSLVGQRDKNNSYTDAALRVERVLELMSIWIAVLTIDLPEE